MNGRTFHIGRASCGDRFGDCRAARVAFAQTSPPPPAMRHCNSPAATAGKTFSQEQLEQWSRRSRCIPIRCWRRC